MAQQQDAMRMIEVLGGAETPQRICFFFNAQRHQLLHGISIAVELARKPGFEVYVVSPAEGHVRYARMVVEKLGGAPVIFVHARSAVLSAVMKRTGSVIPPKLLSLSLLARWLNKFDAIALPERTSIYLRKIGVRLPRFIHLDHGAGDRAAGFDRRIRQFDFVLMAGEKHRERLLGERLIDPDAHAVVGYPKFDAADAVREEGWRPFNNDLPIVLYNPHFSTLGSWRECGERILEAFANQSRYNLLLAPHVRLLDGDAASRLWARLLDRYEDHPLIHIDRGSDRAIDMTHTALADVYLGDVSSQIYEFLRRPRPCVFLNPHRVNWEGDENYAHWKFGPVVSDTTDIISDIDRCVATHGRWKIEQHVGIARTFHPEGGSALAASAVGEYLRRSHVTAKPSDRRGGKWRKLFEAGLGPVKRASLIVPLVFAGWLLHDALEPRPSSAASSPFLDRAVASHRTTRLRWEMRSQHESIDYDRQEIRRATGIAMPGLPKGWVVDDAQVYPSTYGNIVQLVVRTPAQDRVSLVAMRIETPAEGTPLIEDRATEQIAYWENGEFAFALVGQLSANRLLSLAAGIARQPA